MSWTDVVDILFNLGALFAAGLIAYGGWLSITAPEVKPPNPAGAGRSRGVMHVAKPLAPRSRDANRSERDVPALLVCVFISGILGIPALPDAALAGEPLERGIEAYHNLKYQEAMTQFRVAADGGSARAQEILGFMNLHGPSLYGAKVPLDREQAIYWFGRAARGGREVAQHMLCVLTGRPADTVVDRGMCVTGISTASATRRPREQKD